MSSSISQAAVRCYDFPKDEPLLKDENGNLLNCGICLESMDDHIKIVVHTGGGEKHPMHKICLETALQGKSILKCPMCWAPIKRSFLFSLRGRCSTVLARIREVLLHPRTIGLAAAVAFIKIAELYCHEYHPDLLVKYSSEGGVLAGAISSIAMTAAEHQRGVTINPIRFVAESIVCGVFGSKIGVTQFCLPFVSIHVFAMMEKYNGRRAL